MTSVCKQTCRCPKQRTRKTTLVVKRVGGMGEALQVISWYSTCRYFCACALCAHNHINCACTPTTTSIFSENIMCVTEMSPEAKQICCTNASHRRVWPHLWKKNIYQNMNCLNRWRTVNKLYSLCNQLYMKHESVHSRYGLLYKAVWLWPIASL